MQDLQEKLNLLLEKYSVDTKAEILDLNTAIIDGKKLPIFAHRCERRFIEMRNIVNEGEFKGLSTMRIFVTTKKNDDLIEVFKKEADICEWILNDKITEVFAVSAGTALNISAQLASGAVCTFELAATLGENQAVLDKHEIIGEKGVVCDRVVDTQVPQNSIYMFKNNGEESVYTDVDTELFGLSAKECSIVRFVFDMAVNKTNLNGQKKHIDDVAAAVLKSAQTDENAFVEEQ